MRRLLRSLSPPGVAGPNTPLPKAVLPLADLTQLLCFEDKEDASEFCEHVGLELLVRRPNPNPAPGGAPSVWCRPNPGEVSASRDMDIGLQLDALTQELHMPRDKNGHAILPTVRHMHKWIEMDKASSAGGGFLSAALICRGQATSKSVTLPQSVRTPIPAPIPAPVPRPQVSAAAPQLLLPPPPPPPPPTSTGTAAAAPSDPSSADLVRLGQLKKNLLLSGSLSSSRSSHPHPAAVTAIAPAIAKPLGPQQEVRPRPPAPAHPQPLPSQGRALSDRDFPALGSSASSTSSASSIAPSSSLGLGLGSWQRRAGPPSAPAAQPDLSSLQVPNPNPFSSAATLTHRPSTLTHVAAEKTVSWLPAESTRPRPEPVTQQPNPNPNPSPRGAQVQPAVLPIPIPIPLPSSAAETAAGVRAGVRSGPSQQRPAAAPSFERAVDLTSQPPSTTTTTPAPALTPISSAALASRSALLSSYWHCWKRRVAQVRLESRERQTTLLRLGRITRRWRALVLHRRSERSSLLLVLHGERAAPAADPTRLGLGLLSRSKAKAAARSGDDLPCYLVDLPGSCSKAFCAPSQWMAALRSQLQRSQSQAMVSALSITNLARPRSRPRSHPALAAWPGDLFFQVAVVSLARASGLATQQASAGPGPGLVTAIRSALSNEQGSLGCFGFDLLGEAAAAAGGGGGGGLASLTKNQRWKVGAKKTKAARAQLEPATTKNARCIGLFRDPDPGPTETGAGRLTVAVVDVCRGGPRVGLSFI